MTEPNFYDQSGFCPAPWVSLYVDPSGRIDHCCISHSKLGHTPTQDIDEIIASDKNLKIKQDMRYENKLPHGCTNCSVSNDITTLRKAMLQWFDNVDKDLYNDPAGFDLKYLDLRWRNTCNSACVYCGPECSSLWAQELNIPQKINTVQLDSLKAYIDQHIENLQRVYLAGGEPLIVKDNEWLLGQLSERNPNAEIWVNTNLTNIDNKIFETLMSMPKVKFIISAEAIGDKYEYIRYPSKWKDFNDNLQYLIKYKRFSINNFQCVYNSLNMLYLEEFFEWVESLYQFEKYPHLANIVNLTYVNSGSGGWLDPRQLPPHLQSQGRQVLEDCKKRFAYPTLIKQIEEIEHVLNIPSRMIPNANSTQGFITEIDKLDKRRNTDVRKIFPDLFLDN